MLLTMPHGHALEGSICAKIPVSPTSRAEGKHSGVDAKQGLSTGSTRKAANVLGRVPAQQN